MSNHERRMRTAAAEHRNPLVALALPIVAALTLIATGCGGVGDCVAVYEFEGTVRKANYTRAECEEECAIIGRALDCYFDGRAASPLEVEVESGYRGTAAVASTR